MPECPKCHVAYFDGESHNCRGMSSGAPRRRGVWLHFIIAWFLGGLLGAAIGVPIFLLVTPSSLVVKICMGLGMLITFMWLRMRNG